MTCKQGLKETKSAKKISYSEVILEGYEFDYLSSFEYHSPPVTNWFTKLVPVHDFNLMVTYHDIHAALVLIIG